MNKRNYPQESARRILWDLRESLLPHIVEHRNCGVFEVVEEMTRTAGWTMGSYMAAVIFDSADLICEITK